MPENNDQPTPIDPLTIGELITIPEAAKLSGFSQTYLRDIVRKKRLKAKKVGRDWVTTLTAIEEYKNSRKFIVKTDETS
jgi:excisionase family DNA binding protein